MPSTLPSSLSIVLGSWERLGATARNIRFEVFVREQGVPAEIELDEHDPLSLHAVAYTQEQTPVGTGRLLPDGHIGRIAVLRQARGAGVGGRVLDALVKQGFDQGHKKLLLHAQIHAKDFYHARGFAAQGEAFMEAGIAHIMMTREAK